MKASELTLEDVFEFERVFGGYALKRYLLGSVNIHIINIPPKYRGKPIIKISEYAFCGAVLLEYISIPETVSEIGVSAFNTMISLKRINIPHRVSQIKRYTFSDCRKLEEIILPKKISVIGGNAFYNCCDLRSVVFPDKEVEVKRNAFAKCPNLPAETVIKGLFGQIDDEIKNPGDMEFDLETALRPDVFGIALSHGLCNMTDMSELMTQIIVEQRAALLPIMCDNGWLSDKEQVDRLTELAVQNGSMECTVWLLNYKNRSFGFNGGDNYEL